MGFNNDTPDTRDNYTPAFNSSVKAKTQQQEDFFSKHLKQYSEFISWARWYSDLFLDLIRPRDPITKEPVGGIQLHFDQRVFLRSIMRFQSIYGVFPRGWSKTYCEVLAMELTCILFPGSHLSLTAQTKDNASALLRTKHEEIMEHFPFLKSEIIKILKSKDEYEIMFVNGSKIDTLPNAQTAKGQRRTRMSIEEAALIDAWTFTDALKPIVEIGRMTKGKLCMQDPQELNQKIDFFTTAGFRNSDEYVRSLKMIKDMRDLKGEIVLGSGWMLASWMGRGSSKTQILKKKKEESITAFARNYESKWVGATDNQLVDIKKLLRTRNLTTPMYENTDPNKEIVISVDVARSAKSSNNKTIVSVLEEHHGKDGLIKQIDLVNMYLMSNQLNFNAQACAVKRVAKRFLAKIVVVDTNGLGKGLLDDLLRENVDPSTGEKFPAWDTVNGEIKSEYEKAEPMVYALSSQERDLKGVGTINTAAIINFIDCFDGGKIRLLEQKSDNEFDLRTLEGIEEFAPYEQTNLLVEEIANLKLERTNNNKTLTVKKVLNKVDKDRYASVLYGLWWIMTCDNMLIVDDTDLFMNIAKMNIIAGNHKNTIGNLFR